MGFALNLIQVFASKISYLSLFLTLYLFTLQSYLLNIPSWNPKCGDDVVCISEVQTSLFCNL